MGVSARTAAGCVGIAGWLALAPSASGQSPAAAIKGAVRDPAAAPVASARVSLRSTRTGAIRTTLTGPDGRFQLTHLEPGDYDLEVATPGFAGQRKRLNLHVGDDLSVDYQLTLARLDTQVEVGAQTPPINAGFTVAGVIGREQIESLPLNGRSFLELARLEPGVSVESVANPGAFGNNYHRVSVAGAPYFQTHVTVDGSPVDDRINGGTSQNFSQETVQEFQIATFNFDLATGMTASGAVNIVTRRGGNELHGAAFFYYRDHNLAAYPSLRRDARNPDPFFARRQSGLSLSGPLVKDRVFWFANYEHSNQDGVFAVANNHPIFSKLDVTWPSSLDFDLLNLRVDAQLGEGRSAFLRGSLDRSDTIAAPSTGTFMPSNWQKARTRGLQLQSGLTSVLGAHFVNDFRAAYGDLDNRVEAMTAEDCSTPVACIGAGAPFEALVFDAPLFRIGHYLTAPKAMYPHTFDVVDTLTWQSGAHRLQLLAGWEHTTIGASHAFFEGPQITLWGPTDLLADPAARSLYDALPASLRDARAPPPTLDEILQLPVRGLVLGIGDPRQPGPYNHDRVSNTDVIRLSARHTWTIRPSLTLDYGLRYVYRSDIYNQDLGDRPAYLAPVLGGDLEAPGRGAHAFDPSLGFAWSVGRSARTVVRGGAGLYHDDLDFFAPFLERGPLGPSGNGRVLLDGSVAGISFASGPTSMTGADLVPRLPGIKAAIAAEYGDGTDLSVRGVEVVKQGDRIFAPGHETPYAVHVTAGAQRQLARDLSLSVDLVLRRYAHLGGFTGAYSQDQNRFNRPRVTGVDPATGIVSFVRDPVIPLCTPDQARAFDPNDRCSSGPIVVYRSGGTSLYRGLHVKLDKRFASGFQLSASYALAKHQGFAEFLVYDDPASGYGNVAGARRHRLTLSGVWQLPAYTGESRLLRALANTWTLAFISQTDSAPPLNTLLVGLDLDGDGTSRTLLPGTRYNSLGQGLSSDELRELVARYNADVEAATRRVTGPDGTVSLIRPRTPFNQVITPIVLPDRFASGDSFVTQDVRLTRRVALTRSLRLDLIAEVFNVFNVANLTGYPGVLNQLGYGQPTARAGQVFGTGGPRSFQLAARMEF
jgi:hypothetical protein